MDIRIQFVSFFVIKSDGSDDAAAKTCTHYQTMDQEAYLDSELKNFLDGEFERIVKRKAERHPKTENTPTKVGKFIVQPGYGLDSNPNYNLFHSLQAASAEDSFRQAADELVQAYMQASAVRGGAVIVVQAGFPRYSDAPFIFVLKCDFEQKIASVGSRSSLIHQVEQAISAKNMKSIQYPYMPEEGMISEDELKLHQSSHARYFEDFLKFVDYEKSLPEIMSTKVIDMVQQYIEDSYEENSEEKTKQAQEIDLWAAGEQRELTETWTHEQVAEAASSLVEQKPDLEMKFRLDQVTVRTLLSEYGNNIHFAKLGSRYVVLIEGDSFQFDKGISPVELLRPDQLEQVLEKILKKQQAAEAGEQEAAVTIEDGELPF